ncbi:hypothetical protein DOTSEDRAFT_68917 [Dothistroma septosporum NZE10]|uniref:FAD-binding domain-containing protein n=1 Tax=Dothistroma septosporum (strain NZE10 / CBS 128990) TaxID=675120 RepID=N1Q4F6_DOTSN|nr:hypothetical protein DOTSEDRAFT_68917 [Dothistroma septosporum NZE10]
MDTKDQTTPLNIAIIGAGPAGCLLARLLFESKQQISVTLFESESSPNFRSQGGSLDLHETTGQAALKKAGLFDHFLEHARYDGEALKIADKKLLCYVKMAGSKADGKNGTGRPEIDRPKLRELLFNSLPEGAVHWNKKLARVDQNHVLHFADGTSQGKFDLIVGADGAWSKVRPRVSDAQPYYSGIAGHSWYIPDVQNRAPELHDAVNRGSLFSFSDGKSIMAQQMGDGGINVGTWSVRPENWQSSYDARNPKAVKEAARKDYADWDPKLVAFTQEAEDASIAPRDLFMLPIGHKWNHIAGVTLIGDAAHLSTPFAGEGVNLAFEDSMKLADAIVAAAPASSRTSLDKNIADFEADMFKRATATQQLTYDLLTAMYLTPGAPRNGIESYILRAMESEMGPMTIRLLTPVVYAWFFVFKMIW